MHRRDAPLNRQSEPAAPPVACRDLEACDERAAEPPRSPGSSRSLPSSWYSSAAIFALEKERIFCREWLCVARAEELAEPGAYRVLDVLGESIILTRNREGQLRAFYNVCRHRGARLCRDAAAAGAPSGRRARRHAHHLPLSSVDL